MTKYYSIFSFNEKSPVNSLRAIHCIQMTEEVARLDLSSIESRLKNRNVKVLGHEQMKVSSVLVPLIEKEDGLHVLFQVRGKKLRTQPGEICFPGGRVENEDKNETETAIRETCEELGLQREQIKVMAPLDICINPFHAIIHPFVGVILEPDAIRPNELEVEEVFTVPLEYLLNYKPKFHPVKFQVKLDDSFPYHLIPNGKSYKWRTRQVPEYFYLYDRYVIWGLTARILTNFLTVIKQEKIS